LLQTIPTTFQATRSQSLPNNIVDPLANLVAGINYMKSRYGGPLGTPGIRAMSHGGAYQGYADGTSNASSGLKWVGERGPELLKMRGGETVYNAKQSAKIANGSGNDNNNNGGLTLKIENFVNNRKQDIEALATELQFYYKQHNYGGQ